MASSPGKSLDWNSHDLGHLPPLSGQAWVWDNLPEPRFWMPGQGPWAYNIEQRRTERDCLRAQPEFQRLSGTNDLDN